MCPVRRSLGVYVLDALEPAERDVVDLHLARCGECRRELERIASLPELLARLPLVEAERLAPAPQPSAGLLDRLLAAARES
ncbi:MAG: zf-HC2 domain-containing protein, partial [Solirubrobacteraceae bacterium]